MSNLLDNTSKKDDSLTFNESAMGYLEEYDDRFNDLDDDEPTVGNVFNYIVSKSMSSVEKCTNKKTPTNNIQTFNLQHVKKSKHADTLPDKNAQNHIITLKESMPHRETVNLENNTKAKNSVKNTFCNSKSNRNIFEIESSLLAYETNSSVSNRDNINNTKKSHSKQFGQNLKEAMPSYNNVSALVKNSTVNKKKDINVNSTISTYSKNTNNVSKLVGSTNAKKCPSIKKVPCVTKKSKHSQYKNSIKNHVLLKKDNSLKSHTNKSPVVNSVLMNTIEAELNKLHGSVNDFSSNLDKNNTFNDSIFKINDDFDDSDTEQIYLKINEIISSSKSPSVERTKSLSDSVLETDTSTIEKTCVKDNVVKNNINIKTKRCTSDRDVLGSNVSTQINLPSPVIDSGECSSKLSKHNIPISDLTSVNKSKHRDVESDDSQSNIRLINELVSLSRNSNFENNSSVQNVSVQVNMDHVNINASVSLDKDKDYFQNVEQPTEEISIDNVEKNTSEEKDLGVHNTCRKNTNNENSLLNITPDMFEMHNTNADEHSIKNIDVTDTLTKTNNDKALTLDSFIKKMEVKDICLKINGIICEHIKNVVDESTKNVITSALGTKLFNNDSITNSSSNIDKSNIFKTPNKSMSTQITSDDLSKETEVQKHSQNSMLQHTTYLDNSTTNAPTIVTNIIHNLISNKTDLTKRIVQAFGIPYDSNNINEVNVTENVGKTQNISKTIMDMSSDNTHNDSTLQNISSSSKTQLNSTICVQPENSVHRNIPENKDRERKKSRSTSPLPPINEWITLMKEFNKAVKKASISKVSVNSETIMNDKFQQETKNDSITILENFPSNNLNIEDNTLENKNDAANMIKQHFRNKNNSIRQKANKSNLKTSSRCIKSKPNSIETENSMVTQETLSLNETDVEENTLENKNDTVTTKQSCRIEIGTRSQSENLSTSSKYINNNPNYTITTKVANASPILEVLQSNETDIEDNILNVKKKNIRKCSVSSISSSDFNTSFDASLIEKSHDIKSNLIISPRVNLRKSLRCIKNKSNNTEKIELTCSTPISKNVFLCETSVENNTLKIKRKRIRECSTSSESPNNSFSFSDDTLKIKRKNIKEFSTSSESFNSSFSSPDDIKMIKDICKMKNISVSYKANLKKSLRCSEPKSNDTKSVVMPKSEFILKRKRKKREKSDVKDNSQKPQLIQFSSMTNNKRNKKKGIQSDNKLLLTSKRKRDKITNRFLSRVSKSMRIQNLKCTADTSVSPPKAKVSKLDISSIITYITRSHVSDSSQSQSLFSQKLNPNLSESTTSQNFNSSFSETTLNTIEKPTCIKNINSQKQKLRSNDSVSPAKTITRQSTVKKTEVNNISTSTTSRTRINIKKINDCKSDIIKTQCYDNTTQEVSENEEEPPSTRVLRIRKK